MTSDNGEPGGPSSVQRPSMCARLMAGDKIADRYWIVRLIGEGAIGEVYEAFDEKAGLTIALKTLHAGVSTHGPTLQRFRREVELARKVQHRNVCRAFELSQSGMCDGGQLSFITMELLRGVTLADHLAARGALPTPEAVPLALQMTAGLNAAHDAGIVYRDFKPANLMLVAESSGPPRVVLTDFGLARKPALVDDAVTMQGQPVGTPAYMAPEQAFSGFEPITPATDVYAFGSVLYEMLTGQTPFAGTATEILRLKRFRDRPRSPRTIVPMLSANWEEVVLRCLERDPARRFQSAREVEVALLAAETAPPVTAPGGRPPDPRDRSTIR
jgi:eukaryotic-like serine/threonine-protein kinase